MVEKAHHRKKEGNILQRVRGEKMKKEIKTEIKAWEWERNGFLICATLKCSHLVVTPLGQRARCYQSGGVHLYCDSEDTMACGCCGGVNKFKGRLMGVPIKECVMCGNKDVVFQVGSGQKATLNKTDYTKNIESYYKKGDWLCEDCLFK